MSGKFRTAVVGASGYTGGELLRLAAGHPDLDVAYLAAATSAGRRIDEVFPHLAPVYGDRELAAFDPAEVDGYDLVFFALPHGAAAALVPAVMDTVGTVVDLSADFRLDTVSQYEEWYGMAHPHPEFLEQAVLGIPELFREHIATARLIAAAGCYVTAAALPLAPLVAAGLIETTGVIVDAASGVSGSGRVPSESNHFSSVNESFSAYGLLRHRHTPEMEKATGAQILFTPHLAPMTRGILATCYARPIGPADTENVLSVLRDAYRGEPFVRVVEDPPATKLTLGSNGALLTARVDSRTGWVLALGALDNLVKGASGQAIQCANIALGLPEETGLPSLGLFP